MSEMTETLYSEKDILELLGITRNQLHDLTGTYLQNVQDWRRGAFGRPVYTEHGRDKLLAVTGNKTVCMEPGVEFTARVMKQTFNQNPRLLFVELPDGTRGRVKVQDNSNWITGMPVKIVKESREERADVFAYKGRLPRWRGRY